MDFFVLNIGILAKKGSDMTRMTCQLYVAFYFLLMNNFFLQSGGADSNQFGCIHQFYALFELNLVYKKSKRQNACIQQHEENRNCQKTVRQTWI